MKPHKYTKYRPEECNYPVFRSIDYCWGLAGAVDEANKDQFIKRHCPECEYWGKEAKDETQEKT